MQYKYERAKFKAKPELKDEVMNTIQNHLKEKLE
jgi:hypothetical protein